MLLFSSPRVPPPAPVIVYCGTGKRAAAATKILRDHQYTAVYNAGALSDLEYYLRNRSVWEERMDRYPRQRKQKGKKETQTKKNEEWNSLLDY